MFAFSPVRWRGVEGRALAPYLGVLVPFFLFVAYACTLPLDRILSIGGDDGFELSKALLMARHPELANRMWNDQPWLHTMLHAGLFRSFGEHAIFPRVFSLFSLAVLLVAMAHLLRTHVGFLAGAFAAVTLITEIGRASCRERV